MDILVDATAGHSLLSFMDAFHGYNQIKMDPYDAKKIVFRTPMGNFLYTSCHVASKNVGAIYRCEMTVIFHDVLHDCIKDYLNDICEVP